MYKRVLTFSMVVLALLLMAVTFSSCGGESKKESSTNNKESSTKTKIDDIDGFYNYKSDKSITKPPAKGITIGDGRKVTIEYDKSKGDILSYQLFYVDDSGSVIVMGGSTFDEDKDGDGVYNRDLITYTSNADGQEGFMEITTVSSDMKNVQLGMYPVKFKISK